jgi:YfiH family protein
MMDRYLNHTSAVWHVDESNLGEEAPFADAAVTRAPDLSFVMTSADCQTLLAYDPEAHVLGVAHAGWRGTLSGIALSLVRAMEIEGARPDQIRVGLGPAIGPCCYEVGPAVADLARRWPQGEHWLHPGPNGREMLDLSAANEAILRHAGIRQIERSQLCTSCRTDLFYSYRAESPTTGRFAMIAALRAL